MTGTGTSYAEKYQWIKKKQGAHTYFLHEENSICTKLREQGRKLFSLGIQNNHRDCSACRESVSVWSKERPRKGEEWDFRFWLPDKWDESPFFAWSLTLIPHSLIQNCTEAPATDC